MRALAFLLIAVIGLSGCGMVKEMRGKGDDAANAAAPAAPAVDPAAAESEASADGAPPAPGDGEPRPAARPDRTAEAEAKPEPVATAKPTAEPAADPNARIRAQCVARGGTFQSIGLSGARTCVTPTRDANKSCSSSRQCEGMCLARSGTCSPITPLSGCHDIVTNAGNMATVCLD